MGYGISIKKVATTLFVEMCSWRNFCSALKTHLKYSKNKVYKRNKTKKRSVTLYIFKFIVMSHSMCVYRCAHMRESDRSFMKDSYSVDI